MRARLALIGCLLAASSPALAQDSTAITAQKMLQAGSRFYAIAKVCPTRIPTDVERASNYVSLYDEAGRKSVKDTARWEDMVREAVESRIHEVEAVGPQRWCEDQRRYLEELGERKVFPRAR